MMLHYLTKSNFADFGTVLDAEPGSDKLPLDDGWLSFTKNVIQEYTFYHSEDYVYLSACSSMTVLRVTADAENGAIRAFYLDRPVRIKPNVLFQVMPFNSECVFRLFVRNGYPLSGYYMPEAKVDCKIESNMALSEIFSLFYQEKEKGFCFKGEVHRQYELVYVDIGQVHNVVNSTDFVLCQGDMMLIGPNQWHSQYTDESHHACFITITFNWDCQYAALLFDQVIHLQKSQSALLKAMIEESRSDEFMSEELILCYLKQLLLLLVRQQRKGKTAPPEKKMVTIISESSIVEEAVNYIKKHIYERLTVSRVAAHVNVSPSHLSVLFSKALNLSPSEFIRKYKLEESKRMIREGSMNFTEIAEKLSYANIHHFSNQFRATFGMSPTEYSRSLK